MIQELRKQVDSISGMIFLMVILLVLTCCCFCFKMRKVRKLKKLIEDKNQKDKFDQTLDGFVIAQPVFGVQDQVLKTQKTALTEE